MRLVLVFILICFTHLQAQQMLPTFYDTIVHDQSIVIDGNAFHHSSAIKNEIANAFLFGGVITEEMKNRTNDSHELYNRFGGELTGELTYFHKLQNAEKEIGFYVRGGNNILFASDYAASVFRLAMYGNVPYDNQTLNLSNTQGFFINTTKLGGGIYNPKNKNSVGLNVVAVNDFARLNIGNSSLYTNIDNDQLDVEVNAYFQQAVSPAFFQGLGASVDFDYHLPIKEGGYIDGFIKITGRNLGAVRMHKLNQIGLEGTAAFDGFQFSDFNDLAENENFYDRLTDSVSITDRTNGRWVALPGFVQVGKIVDHTGDRKLQSFFGARMYATFGYLPMVYFGGHYRATETIAFGGQVSYGGFGNFRSGVYAGYNDGRYSLSIGSQDFLGLLLNSQYGQSLIIRLQWNI